MGSSDECFFFSSRRRHTRYWRDWSSDVCSSDLTLQRSLIWNFAVWTSPATVIIELPKPTASDEPKLSTITACGMCLSSVCLTSLLHITPEDTVLTMLDVS